MTVGVQPRMVSGWLRGTGAAINVQLGYVPDKVELWNVTDGDKVSVWHRAKVATFNSGGTVPILPGDILQGATTTAARIRVAEVIVDTGTWAGGDAAGWVIFYEDELNGTLTAENLDLLDRTSSDVVRGGGVATANVLTLTAAPSELANLSIIGAVASVTPSQGINPYLGVDGATPMGFTIAAETSEDAKLFRWVAYRFEHNVANNSTGG